MATEITSKSELAALATKLDSKSKEVVEAMNSLSATLKSVSSYDGIDVSSAANKLSGNLTNLSTDFTNISLNISSYAGLIEEFDSDDFDPGDGEITPEDDYVDTITNLTGDAKNPKKSKEPEKPKDKSDEDKNVEKDVTNKVEIQKNEITKQDFLEEYTKISNKISERLLDGTVYDNETLSLAIAKYNKILSSTKESSKLLRVFLEIINKSDEKIRS